MKISKSKLQLKLKAIRGGGEEKGFDLVGVKEKKWKGDSGYQGRSQEFDLGGYSLNVNNSHCPGSRRQNNHIKNFKVD